MSTRPVICKALVAGLAVLAVACAPFAADAKKSKRKRHLPPLPIETALRPPADVETAVPPPVSRYDALTTRSLLAAGEVPLPERRPGSSAETIATKLPETSAPPPPVARGEALTTKTSLAKGDAPLPVRRPDRSGKTTPASSAAVATSEAAKPPATWSDAEVASARTACEQLLAGIAADYSYLPPIREGACGTPQPVAVRAIGIAPRVRLDPPAVMNCPLLARLSGWLEDAVQPAARAELGSPVVALGNATSYACRNRYNAPDQKLSEHALANALDVPSVVTEKGLTVKVVTSWGMTVRELELKRATAAAIAAEEAEAAAAAKAKVVAKNSKAAPPPAATAAPAKPIKPKPMGLGALLKDPTASGPKRKRGAITERPPEAAPKTAESRFLQRIHREACKMFGTVLGPEANAAHADHLHLDLHKRRNGAFCE